MKSLKYMEPIHQKNQLSFQQKINEACYHLAFLLCYISSSKSLDSARQMVNQSGYELKKGESRSKSLQGADCEASSKRCKISESLRIKRISELYDDIKGYSRFKEKRRQQVTDSSRNHKLCDQLTEEMAERKEKRRVNWIIGRKSKNLHGTKKRKICTSSTEVISEPESNFQPSKKKMKQSSLIHASKNITL